jgi:hypothetical protein
VIDVEYTKYIDYKVLLSQVEQCKPRGFPHFPLEMHSVSHKCFIIIPNFISSHQELPGIICINSGSIISSRKNNKPEGE